ncbi:MAG: amidohydrolase family protein [Firmicutes bacterium]|nr:amidohydrolase family protein [Bacillota bacterium]
MALSLDEIPAVDQHCHAFRKGFERMTPQMLRQSLTEATDAQVLEQHTPQTIAYRWALRQCAKRLGCATDEETLVAARNRSIAQAGSAYTRHLLDDAGIAHLCVDTGLQPEHYQDTDTFAVSAARPVHPILRLERFFEEQLPYCTSLDDLVDQTRQTLHALRNDGTIAVKSIAAYRIGLALEPGDPAAARSVFDALHQAAIQHPEHVRLSDPALLDFLLWEALRCCADEAIPVQFHTGYGDPDADLRTASPLHLRRVLEDPDFHDLPVVLLHCYPYVREAGYLAAVYPQVFFDLSLASGHAPSLAEQLFEEAFALAPSSKLLFATDAHSLPEAYWLFARVQRQALAMVLEKLMRNNWLTAEQSEGIAHQILWRNACQLYGLPSLG